MKKIFLLSILFFTIYSCQNSDNAQSVGSPGLLKKIVRHQYNNAGNLSYDDIYEFSYIDGNKLDLLTFKSNNKDLSSNELHSIVKFIYSENGLIIKKEIKRISTNNSNPDFRTLMTYEYDNSNRLIKSIRESYVGSTAKDIIDLEYISNDYIKFTFTQEYSNYIKKDTLKFDSNKNLIYNNAYAREEKFQYDTKLSPCFGIVGIDKIYFIDEGSNYDFYPSYYNNVIKRSDNNNNNGVLQTSNYIYEYNSSNKPIKGTLVAQPKTEIEYFYY